MTYLPIAALFARDAVEEQLDGGRLSAQRAATPRAELAERTSVRPTRSRVRAAEAYVLRRLADQLEIRAPLQLVGEGVTEGVHGRDQRNIGVEERRDRVAEARGGELHLPQL